MTDERLNGLALLFVHPLDYDAVIDEFGKSNRRLQFYSQTSHFPISMVLLVNIGSGGFRGGAYFTLK